MTFWTLILRSLRFHARAHIGVLLGAAVGSAALVGALVVGNSVKQSLKELGLVRLGRVQVAMASNDRFFRAQLANEIAPENNSTATALLQLPGTAATEDASARANHVQVLGVAPAFWKLANQPPGFAEIPADAIVLNQPLATQLHAQAGDTIVLRIQKPSLLSRDAPLTPQEDSSAVMRLKVHSIVSDAQFGRFSLQANQVAPFNAFVNLAELQDKVAQKDRANLLLWTSVANDKTESPEPANKSLRDHWQLSDAELELHALTIKDTLEPRSLPLDLPMVEADLELRSDRVFLDPPVVDAARKAAPNALPLITYFVNELRVADHSTPYSMVTAMQSSVVPADMRDDEILLNDWLAEDLHAKPGDALTLVYFIIGNGRALEERTNVFHVRGVVPLSGPAGDRTLMPDFPGLAKAESERDWDAGFPIQLDKIRPQDEKYWKDHRGTPKAFVTLAAGQKMWANRFGDFTALRFPRAGPRLEELRKNILHQLNPASVGLSFQPVRQQALDASSQSTDFGGLFIGFSLFLIVAALLLMALMFQFGLEQRATEIGTLLALGFRPRQVRRLLLCEGALLALLGGIIGAAGGIFYARAMLHALTTVWRSAVGTSALQFHVTPETLIIGIFAGTIVGALTIWLALRKQARRPARELLAEGAEERLLGDKSLKRSRGGWIGIVSGLLAVGLLGYAIWQRDTASADTFFSAGALLLIAGLGFAAAWLAALGRKAHASHLTMSGLGLRGSTRRRKRSLATIGLLSCGAFLIIAIGAFRLDANQNATKHSSGTGGFALIGESTLPITYDLNSRAGQDFYGLHADDLKGVEVVSFRVRDGDDASCLNLNRAQKPRLLGVNPDALQKRKAFTFTDVVKGASADQSWSLLKNQGTASDEVPAIADANSIEWALHKKLGDTLDYTDERGRPFKVRLVGAVANSVLQGSLIIDEAAFVKRFPDESGYRMFLIDAPSNNVANVSATLARSLQDAGLELTPATQRLNAYNAVQNTYLSTFQVLGGLGLLLGSAGLGVVVLRNVQERRGELGLLVAVGFRRRALQWLVLSEHGALLVLGLAVGIIAALVGVMPALLSPGSEIPYGSLALTLGAVLLNGLVWTWLATRVALRGRLLDALRNE
jgi:putative ABC transport system permease protein